MSAAYPDSHKIYATLNGVRTDITPDVIDTITGGDWGIMGNKMNDRIGNTGWLKFTLRDESGYYTPNSDNAIEGWDIGTVIELEIIFQGLVYLFRFYIKKIDPPKTFEDIRTFISCVDWFDFASETPIENPGILTNQTGDQVLDTAIALVSEPPQNTNFDTGVEVFPTTFDTTTSNTKVYDEGVKVAFSELGHFYLIKDNIYGETLRFEKATSRSGLRTLSEIPLSRDESPSLLKEDGGHLLKEDGGRLLIYSGEEAIFDNSFISPETSFGDHLINYITVWANPRRIDTSAQVLFKLDAPFVIPSGHTYDLKGTYADPAGGLPINAQNMITPVITTDYLGNTLQDGTGTNISSDITLVSVNFGTEGFTIQIRNNNAAPMWITKFNCRGYGIYNYNPTQSVTRDQDSINRYKNIFSETINQKYMVDVGQGALFAKAEIHKEKNTRLVLNKILLCANHSTRNMQAFLNIKPGDLVRVKFDRVNIDSYFYIQGVDDITIGEGGVIFFKWVLKETLSLSLGLSMIAVKFSDLEAGPNNDAIDFGVVPHINNARQRTLSAWVNTPSTGAGAIFSTKSDHSGWDLELRNTRSLFLTSFDFDFAGSWYTADNIYPLNTWFHVAVSYDTNSVSNDPIIYVNGVTVSLTEFQTPSGAKDPEVSNIVIGNINRLSNQYGSRITGTIKDVRIYNRILSVSEIAELYNAGTPDYFNVQDGMIFQAPVVRTDRLSEYIDNILGEGLEVLDNIRGVVGNIHGTPIGQTP
jgi:hypothetical protein